jgi:hypothetical protein
VALVTCRRFCLLHESNLSGVIMLGNIILRPSITAVKSFLMKRRGNETNPIDNRSNDKETNDNRRDKKR